jgi:hypothetical protein
MRMLSRSLATAGLLLLLPALASAQTPARRLPGPGVISGTVLSEPDGAPVAAATVAVRRMADSVVVGGKITDRQGKFRVDALQPGRYLVQVSAVGKATRTQRDVVVTAEAPTAEVGTIRLAAQAVRLEGVVAVGQTPPMRMASDRTIYTLKDMPVVAGGVATDVLRTVPEVEVDVEGKITAMGATPAVHINGRPAPMQGDALTAFLQTLPADRIDRIEYIPNPSAKYEAEGQGGILNIVLKENVSLGLSGTLSANAGTQGQQGGSARLNYQEGRFTFFGGGSGSRSASRSWSKDLRENLLAQPLTSIQQDSRSSNHNLFGSGDVTAEWKLSQRSTLWSGARGYISQFNGDGTSQFLHMDALQAPTQRYDRVTGSDGSYGSGYGSLGLRHVVQPSRDEQSAELRYTRNSNDNGNLTERYLRGLQSGELLSFAPDVTDRTADQGDGTLSLQADVSHPWTKDGRIDYGYRGTFRSIRNETLIDEFTSAGGASPVLSTNNAFQYREAFNSLYVTVDRKVGKVGIQLGARAERADTRFLLPRDDQSYVNDYQSIYPSANVSYDLGKGRQMRFSFSRRLERPQPYMLNPINSSNDPLNQFVGNPQLKPVYTNSFNLESSWTRPFGSVRVAPYYRRSVNVWDNLRQVDAQGVSRFSFYNLASSQTYGSNLSVSLRKLGPLSGLVSASGYRTLRDASNLSQSFSGNILSWSASGNLSARITSTLSAQTQGFFSPARQLPQGRISSYAYITVGARKQLMDNKAALNLSIVDPFNSYHQRLETSDLTHRQTSSSSFTMRRLSLSLNYNFGRPPQSARRNTSPDDTQQQPDQGGAAGGLR